MQTFIERLVKGESGVTAYGLMAVALMLICVGTWVIATAPRVVASPQIDPLEMMANAKDLPSSLATTQNSPAAVAQPRTAPAASESKSQTGPWSHDGTKHHKKIYMSANSTHKHKQLGPSPQVSIP